MVARGDQFAVEQVHSAVGETGVTWVMCDHANGRTGLVEFFEQMHHLLAMR